MDEKKRLKTQATHEELLPCLDYLHGDVVDNEFAAACCYEYAREWDVPDRTDDEIALEKEIARKLEEDEIVFKDAAFAKLREIAAPNSGTQPC